MSGPSCWHRFGMMIGLLAVAVMAAVAAVRRPGTGMMRGSESRSGLVRRP